LLGFGEVLALFSGFCYAAASVSVAKSAAYQGGDNGALLSVIITAGAALAIFAWTGPVPNVSYGTLSGLAWFALSGLLTVILGRALFFKSIASIGPIRASAVNRLNPFFSVLLAATLLGERVKPVAGLGMALIATSFVVLIRQLLARQRAQAFGGDTPIRSEGLPWLAYAFGPASAFSYASGYIARKLGLNQLPDSNFGTFVGAFAALSGYLVAALFVERYRAAFRRLPSDTTRWHVLAASFVSAGQIAQFGALKYIEVSRVVMLTSVEIFVAMFLSVYVLRTERRPDPATIAAAIVAGIGVVLISLS
jgi:drug/metabolite transporter (DMT)-like permease